MKNLLLLSVIFTVLLSASSCKKETPLPSDTHHTTVAHTYSNYAVNYLQIGNYWVYNKSEAQTTYIDSVSVESLFVKGEADTFYCMAHYFSGGLTYVFRDYARITEAGMLIDTLGKIIFDYSALPVNSDSTCRSAMKCRWQWSEFEWGNDTTFTTGCCTLTGRNYSRTETSEDCPMLTGNETYILGKGIGMVSHSYRGGAYPPSVSNTQLKRFFIKH